MMMMTERQAKREGLDTIIPLPTLVRITCVGKDGWVLHNECKEFRSQDAADESVKAFRQFHKPEGTVRMIVNYAFPA